MEIEDGIVAVLLCITVLHCLVSLRRGMISSKQEITLLDARIVVVWKSRFCSCFLHHVLLRYFVRSAVLLAVSTP